MRNALRMCPLGQVGPVAGDLHVGLGSPDGAGEVRLKPGNPLAMWYLSLCDLEQFSSPPGVLDSGLHGLFTGLVLLVNLRRQVCEGYRRLARHRALHFVWVFLSVDSLCRLCSFQRRQAVV